MVARVRVLSTGKFLGEAKDKAPGWPWALVLRSPGVGAHQHTHWRVPSVELLGGALSLAPTWSSTEGCDRRGTGRDRGLQLLQCFGVTSVLP